jgi:protein SCO1/2
MRQSVAVACARTVLIAATLAIGACRREPEWRGTAVLPAKDIPAFTFLDSTGAPVRVAPATGLATLVFFGYTHCPDVCPTTLSDWVRVKKALGSDTSRTRFLFVTVDPERDSPAIVARYTAQFDSAFVGLSGDSATTAGIQRAFGVASSKEKSSSAEGYLVGHSSQVFLVDDHGQLRVSYDYGAGWDAMSADIKMLLR